MKKPSGKGGRRHLDDDEEADWHHTARSIEPLKRAKPRVHAAIKDDEETPAQPRTKPEGHHRAHAHHGTKNEPKSTPAAAAKKAAPPIADFDRKKVRKIRSGRIEIEARIDLHGMRQDEAYAALRAFLFRCQGRDQRWVLVITGKGRKADDDRHEPFDMTVSRDRGVLKRNVPRWLEEPDLRPLVVSYTFAAISHGGEGALYIHLRKRGGH